MPAIPELFSSIHRDAAISPCGRYRWSLRRIWDPAVQPVAFVMLNPSTADAEQDDPTIRRCMGFARSWGHGGLVVVNLFAYRATNPAAMKGANDPVGPENDQAILAAASSAARVVCAWGTHGSFQSRDRRVAGDLLAAGIPLHALELTKDGHPRHPLYVKGDKQPVPYGPREVHHAG